MNNPKVLLYPAWGFELVMTQRSSEFLGSNSRESGRVPPCYRLESTAAYPASLLKGNGRFEGSTDSCSGNTKSGFSLRLNLGRGP